MVGRSGMCLVASGLTTADYLVLGLYLAAMLAMGIVIALRQRSTEDFFVGGRNLPAWAVGISLLASLLSTITYLGMPGEMFRTGLGFLTRQLGVPFVLVVVWFLWIPFFMRLRLTSAYEYLERRFNYVTRAAAAVFCLILLLGWMAVVVLTASNAMAEIGQLQLDWFFGRNEQLHRDADMHAIILAIGLFSVLYTTLGGIRAVIWTDVIQFLVLVVGALFTIGYVMLQTGSGLGDWIAASRAYEYREQVEWFSWDVRNRSTVFSISIGMFFWFICTHGANQVALQRYFSVKDAWQARKSYLISALASFGLGLVLACVGVALIYYIQEPSVELEAERLLTSALEQDRHTAQDKVFPQFIATCLPVGLRGLVVAALFAAAMSTIDSGANSISTIVTVDYLRRLRPSVTAAGELRVARLTTASMGLIIVAATVFLYHVSKGSDIISLMQKGFNCFLGPLGGLFVLALFTRIGSAAALAGLLAGELTGVVSSYSQELLGQPFSTHLVVPLGWLVTVGVGLLTSLIFQNRCSPAQASWRWGEVIRLQSPPA